MTARATPWTWGDAEAASAVRAIVTQTGDPRWRQLEWAWFPRLEMLYDGRNSLADMAPPAGVGYAGVGVRGRPAEDASVPARG